MKDIEAIRKKFEEEIRLAELANDFERKFGIEPITFSMRDYDVISVKCDNKTAASVLNGIEPTEEILLNSGYTFKEECRNMYKIMTSRGYSDRCSTMEVSFKCGNIEYDLHIEIDGNEPLSDFFTNSMRPIVDPELSTYHPIKYDGTLNRGMKIPCMKFKCGKTANYYGGVQVLTDADEIKKIIEHLKEL